MDKVFAEVNSASGLNQLLSGIETLGKAFGEIHFKTGKPSTLNSSTLKERILYGPDIFLKNLVSSTNGKSKSTLSRPSPNSKKTSKKFSSSQDRAWDHQRRSPASYPLHYTKQKKLQKKTKIRVGIELTTLKLQKKNLTSSQI